MKVVPCIKLHDSVKTLRSPCIRFVRLRQALLDHIRSRVRSCRAARAWALRSFFCFLDTGRRSPRSSSSSLASRSSAAAASSESTRSRRMRRPSDAQQAHIMRLRRVSRASPPPSANATSAQEPEASGLLARGSTAAAASSPLGGRCAAVGDANDPTINGGQPLSRGVGVGVCGGGQGRGTSSMGKGLKGSGGGGKDAGKGKGGVGGGVGEGCSGGGGDGG